jgi:hypothetical protein
MNQLVVLCGRISNHKSSTWSPITIKPIKLNQENIMSNNTIKLLIAGFLLLHGLGHFGALVAILGNWSIRGTSTGAWLPARSWLLPNLTPQAAKVIASIFWILSLLGFVTAAMSFWGLLLPGDLWRQLALVTSVISALGIFLFLGNWPTFNTVAALAANLVVLVTQLWSYWPPQSMFGK